uniref:Putative ovule protein n=1 Tax=Solanum chacoense TaxID=4108 RepID=A0A0V0IS01_SOLCH
MTREKEIFLSLEAYQGESGIWKAKKDIIRIGKIEKSHSHAIENIHHVKALKHSLLSVSRMCDKGNQVVFTSDDCTVSLLQVPNSRTWFFEEEDTKMYIQLTSWLR